MKDFIDFMRNETQKKQFELFKNQTLNVCDFFLTAISSDTSVEIDNRRRAIKEIGASALARLKAITIILGKKLYLETVICWRSLFETESLLCLLSRESVEVSDEYYIFRTGIKSICAKKKELAGDKKDSKWSQLQSSKFRSYGWIHKAVGYSETTKISFQGLLSVLYSERKEDYRFASEIVHALKFDIGKEEIFDFCVKNTCRSAQNIITVIKSSFTTSNTTINEYLALLKSWLD